MEKQLQEHIESLLRLYDEARTTDEQEAELAAFFRTTKDVPEEWIGYADLFSVFDTSESLFSEDELDDCLMQPISQQDTKPKTHRVWLYSVIGAVAASVLLIILGVNGLFHESPQTFVKNSMDSCKKVQRLLLQSPQTLSKKSKTFEQKSQDFSPKVPRLFTKSPRTLTEKSVQSSSKVHGESDPLTEEMFASTEKNEVTSAETEELASVVEPVEDKPLDIKPQPMYDYDPRMEDPFLMAEKHIRDIRSPGERLQQEVALVMNR